MTSGTTSDLVRRAWELVEAAAAHETPVLLLGEAGTGKRWTARRLHRLGPRAKGRFVTADCAGAHGRCCLADLFGIEDRLGEGGRHPGLIDLAAGGTLFFRELAEVPAEAQPMLLRVVEAQRFRRVDGTDLERVDVRILCASRYDLKERVERGSFLADLYYRIAAFSISLPPLRERLGDLPMLVEALLCELSPDRPAGIEAAALRALAGRSFPGNIAELRNLLEQALLKADGRRLQAEHFLPVRDARAEERPLCHA